MRTCLLTLGMLLVSMSAFAQDVLDAPSPGAAESTAPDADAAAANPALPANGDGATPAGPLVVRVELLDGKRLDGELQSLTVEELRVTGPEGDVVVPLRDVQGVAWDADPASVGAGDVEPADTPEFEVSLQDGSQIRARRFEVQQRQPQISLEFGDVLLPAGSVRAVRLAPADDMLAAAWAELITRETKNDLLVVRKGAALDFVGGVLGEVSAADVKLLVRDRDVVVPRARAFGLIYVPRPPAAGAAPPLCEVLTAAGDRLRVSSLELSGGELSMQLNGGGELRAPIRRCSALDLTLGKVRRLGELPFDQRQDQPSPLMSPSVFIVRQDRTSLGLPLKIGRKEFSRGLWMHSGVTAVFRLSREYRRLQATVGVDGNSPELPRAAPRMQLVLRGDGKVLHEAPVAWDDEPLALDLDVAGVRELEITVQAPGETPGVLEHLVLGDARVSK